MVGVGEPHTKLLMATEIQAGEDILALIPITREEPGGELILEDHIQWLKSELQTEVIVALIDSATLISKLETQIIQMEMLCK